MFIILVFMWQKQTMEHVVYDDEQKGLQKQIVIYFSHVVAENTPKGLAAQKFAELVKEKTNGRVKVEVFPNGSLYSDEEEIDALLRGDVQMIAPSVSKVTQLLPEWQVIDLPFIFESYDDVERAFTGEVGKRLLAMLEKKEMKGLALWGNGFKQVTSNRRLLIEPSDFSGLKFRVMPSEIIEKQFQLLGAKPIVVPFNHVYESLEKHAFDGQENTISTAVDYPKLGILLPYIRAYSNKTAAISDFHSRGSCPEKKRRTNERKVRDEVVRFSVR